MADIAQIGFKIDTSDVTRAGQELASFSKKTQFATQAIQNFEGKGSGFNNIINSFEKGFNKVGDVLENAFSSIFKNGGNFFDSLKNGFSGLIKNLGKDLLSSNVLNPLKKGFSSLLGGIFGGASSTGGAGSGGGIISNITGTLSNVFGSIFGGSQGASGGLGAGLGGLSALLPALGPIGSIAAVALPLIEPIKDFLKSRRKRSELKFDTLDGSFGASSIKATSGGSKGAVNGIFQPVAKFIGDVLEQQEAKITNRISGRVLFKRDKSPFLSVNGVNARVKKSQSDKGAGFILRQFFLQGEFEGLSQSIKTVVKNTGNSFKKLAENIQFAQIFDSLVDGSAFKPAKSQIEKAIDNVSAEFVKVFDQAAQLGLDTSKLLAAEQVQINKIKDGFLKTIDDGILAITNSPALQLQNLLNTQEKRQEDAKVLNLNPNELARLEKLSLLERRELLKTFDSNVLEGLTNIVDASDIFATKQAIIAVEITRSIEEQIKLNAKFADSFRRGGEDINSFLEQLKFGNLSPLSDNAKLAESRSRFGGLLSSANAGDANSLALLPKAAEQLLALSKQVNASNDIFQTDFSNTQNALALSSNNAFVQANSLDKESLVLTSIKDNLESLDQSILLQEQVDLLASINGNLTGQNIVNLASTNTNNNNGQNLLDLLQSFVSLNTTNSGVNNIDSLLSALQQNTDIDQAGLQLVSGGIDDLILEIKTLRNQSLSTQDLLQQVISNLA